MEKSKKRENTGDRCTLYVVKMTSGRGRKRRKDIEKREKKREKLWELLQSVRQTKINESVLQILTRKTKMSGSAFFYSSTY